MQRIDHAGSVHDQEENYAVVEVLKDPATALRIGRIMVDSGSSALYLAVELLDPSPGDEIVTEAVTR